MEQMEELGCRGECEGLIGQVDGKQRNGVPLGKGSCRKEEKFGGREASRVCQFISVLTAEVNRRRPDT